MPLNVGTQLGSYEITALLGKGGMGEVYRARDAKLKREVAIKVLPEEFSRDGDRASRFQREAEVLASLNHPNIGAIYDLQEANDLQFLVLELVEGETLAERIQRGRIAVDEALQIAHGICEALEAAHEKGIIHRDLKPGNVKITPEGKVKVLDFGLAKALDAAPGGGNLSNSPTLTIAGTQAGVILGTAAYMSPEQAKGFNTDQRSDIFSFGAVLYEMLTGRHAFQGDNVSEVLASVLAREPDFGLLPPKLNPLVERLLRRCMEKNPKRRWHAVGDLRVELEAVLADPGGLIVEEQIKRIQPAPSWKRSIAVLLTIVLTALIAGALAWLFKPSPALMITRFPIPLGEGQTFTLVARRYVAISPDGTQVVYVANQRLYHRWMWEMDAKPIPGAESQSGAPVTDPVFSPDSQSLVFFSAGDQTLKKIAVTGGATVTLCSADPPFGMSWGLGGVLVGQGIKGIMRVDERGGKPETIVTVKPGEFAHGPQFLPGGDAILFTLGTGTNPDVWDKAQIMMQSLKTGMRSVLIEGGSDARYVPTGHIVYGYGTTLFAVPFDSRRLAVTGAQVPVVEGVRRSTGTTGTAQYSYSNNGTLVFAPSVGAGQAQLSLIIVDRKGSIDPLKLPQQGYMMTPRISPDGKNLAIGTDNGRDAAIWVYELSGATAMRRLTQGGPSRYPVWTPDGRRIAFQSDRDGDRGIWWQAADGSGSAERLTKPEPGTSHIPDSWSKDGPRLSYSAYKANSASIHILSVQDRKDVVFAESSMPMSASVFSPDGKWIAYHSFETGRPEVWVRPFPATGGNQQVSKDGGFHPFWSRDGKELFFSGRTTGLTAVTVTAQAGFTFGFPVYIPLRPFTPGTTSPRNVDVTANGKFISIVSPDQAGSPGSQQLNVVLNWFEELKQRVPVH
jgi:serine/threonine-protein kinase